MLKLISDRLEDTAFLYGSDPNLDVGDSIHVRFLFVEPDRYISEIFVPSIGRVAGMYGRKRLYILGLLYFLRQVLFFAASAPIATS